MTAMHTELAGGDRGFQAQFERIVAALGGRAGIALIGLGVRLVTAGPHRRFDGFEVRAGFRVEQTAQLRHPVRALGAQAQTPAPGTVVVVEVAVGVEVVGDALPNLVTMPASSLRACRTSVRSTFAASVGETRLGSSSTARHTAPIWSSPTAPASTAAANSGSSGGTGGPVSERRGRIRAASLNRRVISLGVMRSRAHSMSRNAATTPVSSGGSAISPKTRYISPRLTRCWVSNRSATSTRNLLPTTSEEVSRKALWAASMASRAAPIRSRACSALTGEPMARRYAAPVT